MKINSFEEILAWQKARELTILIYKLFDKHKDFGFKDQIQRASVSIMNNIAEGYERRTNKELKSFLFTAKGSSAEVRSMTHLGADLLYINHDDSKRIIDLSLQISRMLSGFIKTL